MISNSRFNRATAAGFAAALLCALAVAAPVRAADPIFPVGSRLGLVPPPGMVASETFDGFADPTKDAAILIAMLPAAAYAQIEKSMEGEALKKQGVNIEKREPMQVSFGKGFLLTGRQTADKMSYRKWLLVASASDFTALVSVQIPDDDSTYPDTVVRAALATLTMRAEVPQAEQLSLLPFVVGDFAGFHVKSVLRGRALLLGDDPALPDAGKTASDAGSLTPRLFIAAVPGGPKELDDHDNFARSSFQEIGGIRDVQVSVAEPLRINGQSGYQIMAQAKDARNGADVMVVQWLRFGGGGYLQMVGIARAGDQWTGVLARLRTVRDSVETK
jgi:hypothetical protein